MSIIRNVMATGLLTLLAIGSFAEAAKPAPSTETASEPTPPATGPKSGLKPEDETVIREVRDFIKRNLPDNSWFHLWHGDKLLTGEMNGGEARLRMEKQNKVIDDHKWDNWRDPGQTTTDLPLEIHGLLNQIVTPEDRDAIAKRDPEVIDNGEADFVLRIGDEKRVLGWYPKLFKTRVEELSPIEEKELKVLGVNDPSRYSKNLMDLLETKGAHRGTDPTNTDKRKQSKQEFSSNFYSGKVHSIHFGERTESKIVRLNYKKVFEVEEKRPYNNLLTRVLKRIRK